ncbi:DUF2490 domain-containing protein [Tenuifilum sp.]|jgi:hypothetical protein|uniref:DUF2490 domain-containing protein n=1 Tax=Tenuifilum sp. TaxID=2760880 RepID=UPI00258E6E54|nr:DUF2490 domain-containing protein [Tenuifilum sp.]
MKSSIIFALLLVGLLFGMNTYSQVSRTFWTGANANLSLSKKVDVSFSPEIRLIDDMSIDKLILETDAKIKFHKLFQLGISYRYYRFHDDPGEYFNAHRLGINVRTNIGLGRFKLSNRFYYFHRLINRYNYGYSIETQREFREGIKLSYNIKGSKIEPFIQSEIYFDVSPNETKEFSKIRFRTGIEYPLNKKSSIDLFFQLQDKLNTNNPLRTYTLGVYYNFDIQKAKSKNDSKD